MWNFLSPAHEIIPDQTKYKSFDKDWLLIFINVFEKNTPGEICNLML